METSIWFKSNNIRFIIIFYRILLLFFGLIIASLVLLNINDSVNFYEGYIYSKKPKININSPNETKLLSMAVQEGQIVQKGDTLIVLENKKVISEYNIATTRIQTLQDKIKILENLISKAQQQKKSYQKLIAIQNDIYRTDYKILKQEIRNLQQKANLSSRQTHLLSHNYNTDSTLYTKGVISRIEFEKRKNQVIDDRKAITDMSSALKKKQYDLKNLSNRFKENKNNLNRSIIEIDRQIVQYQQEIIELNSSLDNEKFNLEYISEEVDKLFIIAPSNGTIAYLFNTKQTPKVIPKNELLITIAPQSENHYAKIILPEKDLIYVKKGQKVNLKVDAYNYYKYGYVKGNVAHVSQTDTKGVFYCLVDIKKHQKIDLKAGYKFTGDIIIEEMKLYDYILKSMFKKIDKNLNTNS